MNPIRLVLPFPPSDNNTYDVVQPGRAGLVQAIEELRAGRIAERTFIDKVIDLVERLSQSRVFLSGHTRAFRKHVQRDLQAQLGVAPRLSGRLAVKVELNVPDLKPRDIANYLKALCDALTLAGLWVDDEQIDWLQIHRSRLIHGGRCVLEVIETAPAAVQLSLDDEAALQETAP